MATMFGNPQIKMTQQTSLRVDFPSGPFNYQERKTAGPSHYYALQTVTQAQRSPKQACPALSKGEPGGLETAHTKQKASGGVQD